MNREKILKLKDGFLLREIAGRIVVVSMDDSINLMISLNSTGRFLWERLEKGASPWELTEALMEVYDISETLAQTDVDAFIEQLNQNGFLE